MKKKFLGLLTIFYIVNMSSVLVHADIIDIVTNGNFDDGFTGWGPSPGFSIDTIDIDGPEPLYSSQAAGVYAGNTWSSLGQHVDLLAGYEYTFSADLASHNEGQYSNSDGGQVYVALSGTSYSGFGFGAIDGSTWEYGTLSFSITPTQDMTDTWLYIGIRRNYQSSLVKTYIDNISFTYDDGNTNDPSEPVPEPATVLLFGTGLAGLAGMRKRSKK